MHPWRFQNLDVRFLRRGVHQGRFRYGNFVEKFPSYGTGIFLAPKAGTGLSCTIYKIPVNFSLSLDMKPGTGNPNKWYRKFGSFGKNGKKVIPRKVFLFFRIISTRMNGSIWILPGIFGFSIQMVSAPEYPEKNFSEQGREPTAN